MDCLAPLPPTASTSRAPLLDADAIALTGPFTSSALFHLAIHLVKHALIPDWSDAEPPRPPCVLVISPDRKELHRDLVSEPDAWLAEQAGTPAITRILEHVVFRFCPTAAHLSMLLLALTAKTGKRQTAAELPSLPTALIVHNVSAYIDPDDSDASCVMRTMRVGFLREDAYRASSLSSLVSQIVDTARHLNSDCGKRSPVSRAPPTKVVILDPSLATRSLPILPASLRKGNRRAGGASSSPPHSPRSPSSSQDQKGRLALGKVLDYFCDVVGETERLDPPAEGAEGDDARDGPRQYKLTYRPSPRRPREGATHIEIAYSMTTRPLANGNSDRELDEYEVTYVSA